MTVFFNNKAIILSGGTKLRTLIDLTVSGADISNITVNGKAIQECDYNDFILNDGDRVSLSGKVNEEDICCNL